MTKPHILFVANSVLGWATYADQFAAALVARSDVHVTVLRRKPPRLWMQIARRHADSGIMRQMRPFDPIRMHAGPLGRDIRQAVMQHRPDVVHFAAHWPAGAIAYDSAAPPFTLALDATRAGLTRDLPLPGWRMTECEAEARLCRRAADIFPMSNWAGQSLIRDYGVQSDHIQITPPCLHPDQWPPPSQPKNSIPQILFVGNDLERKGAARLARWVEGPLSGRCHLHIVSTDTRPPPRGPHITFHGRVPHDRLLGNLMPQMDLFCLPTWLDMSPFVLAESAAAGLPAVASHLGGIPDMITNGITGFLVPAADEAGFIRSLADLIDNTDLRRDMSRAARTLAVDRFDGKNNFNAVIDRLIKIGTAQRTA